jgi:uncharacterized membrane protein
MNRQAFLNTLRNSLSGLTDEDKNEILYDYEEHFRIGMEQGKSEQEIADALGDVRAIARQYKADCLVRKAESDTSTGNVVRAVMAAGLLGFFNLAVVLGPFMGVVGVFVGLFATSIGMVVAGIATIIGVILAPLFPDYVSLGGLNPAFTVFFSIGITCLGLLFFIGVSYLTKFFYIGTVKYLKWNLEFVKG